MKKEKSNLLQKKQSCKKDNKKEEKGVKYIENLIKENQENARIVEITPKISSTDVKNQNFQKLSFDKKVEIVAENLRQQILQLHKEGNSVRFIGNQIGVSRELVRKVINGEGTLKIIAMQRVRMQEIQNINF